MGHRPFHKCARSDSTTGLLREAGPGSGSPATARVPLFQHRDLLLCNHHAQPKLDIIPSNSLAHHRYLYYLLLFFSGMPNILTTRVLYLFTLPDPAGHDHWPNLDRFVFLYSSLFSISGTPDDISRHSVGRRCVSYGPTRMLTMKQRYELSGTCRACTWTVCLSTTLPPLLESLQLVCVQSPRTSTVDPCILSFICRS
jgi:hypothetical protein